MKKFVSLLCLLLTQVGWVCSQDAEDAVLKGAGAPADAASIREYLRSVSIPELTRDDVIRHLHALGSGDFRERQQATAALLKTPEDLLPLIEAAKADGNAEKRLRAEKILEKLGRAPVSDREAMTRAVLQLIAREKILGLGPELVAACPQIRSRQAWRSAFFATIGDSDEEFLIKGIKDSSPTVRMASAEALFRLDPRKGVTAVAPLLKDPVELVRLRAAIHLLNHGEIRALYVLGGLLESEKANVRLLAVSVLRRATGLEFKFDPFKPEESAISSWNEWIKKEGLSARLVLPVAVLPLSESLILHLDCEDAGEALDSSPEENHGEVRDAHHVAEGKIGSAFALDGEKSHLRIPNSPALEVENEVSVSAWIKLDSFGPGGSSNEHGYVVNKGNAMWWNSAFALGFEKGSKAGEPRWPGNPGPFSPLFIVGGEVGPLAEPGIRVSSETHKISVGVWHHLVGTFDGKALRLYVDGELAGEVAHAGKIRTDKAPVLIGGARLGGVEFGRAFTVNGLVDEVRIYRVALDAEEVALLNAWGS